MHTTAERGMSARLSNAEKRELSIQARAAWHKLSSAGAIDEDEDAFRHRIAIQACGRRVSEALRSDYHAISAAFLAMGGDTRRALRVAERAETEPRRIALHKLNRALAEMQLNASYAEAICMRQFKRPIAEASAKQIWALFYTVTNRGRAKQRKATAQSPAH